MDPLKATPHLEGASVVILHFYCQLGQQKQILVRQAPLSRLGRRNLHDRGAITIRNDHLILFPSLKAFDGRPSR